MDADLEEVEAVADKTNHNNNPNTEVPSILTFLLANGRGVVCISDGGGEVIFVRNPPLVRGRMSTPQSLQNNEKLTSSAKILMKT